MAKKRKKQNKPRPMPPLTRLDKGIYWALAVVGLAVLFGIVFLWERTCSRIAFSGEDVIASRTHMSFLWAFPGFFGLFFTGLGLWCWGYCGRRPIFGIPGFLYGPPVPKIYPLFMKGKPPKKPRDIIGFRRVAAVIVILNLILLAPVSLSFQGRDSLHADGTVRNISMLGRVREEYDPLDTEEVILSVYTYKANRSRVTHWSVKVELVMNDGKCFEFPVGSFRSGEDNSWVLDLEQLLEQYPAQSMTFQRADEWECVVEEMELSEEEAQLLRRLFRIQ